MPGGSDRSNVMKTLLVREDPLGTRRLKGVELAVQVLVFGADAGVSDDHAVLCQKPPKTAKVLSWVFVPAKSLMSGVAFNAMWR